MLIHSIKPRLRKIKQVTKSFVSLQFSTSSNNPINLSYYLNILKYASLLIILLEVWSVARKYAFNPPKIRFRPAPSVRRAKKWFY
jgi:hypothetical protein